MNEMTPSYPSPSLPSSSYDLNGDALVGAYSPSVVNVQDPLRPRPRRSSQTSSNSCVSLIRVGTITYDNTPLFNAILAGVNLPLSTTGWVLEALRRLRAVGIADTQPIDDAFEWEVEQQGVVGIAVRATASSVNILLYSCRQEKE